MTTQTHTRPDGPGQLEDLAIAQHELEVFAASGDPAALATAVQALHTLALVADPAGVVSAKVVRFNGVLDAVYADTLAGLTASATDRPDEAVDALVDAAETLTANGDYVRITRPAGWSDAQWQEAAERMAALWHDAGDQVMRAASPGVGLASEGDDFACPAWCVEHTAAEGLDPAKHVGRLRVPIAHDARLDADELVIVPAWTQDGQRFVDVCTDSEEGGFGDLVSLSPSDAGAFGRALVEAAALVEVTVQTAVSAAIVAAASGQGLTRADLAQRAGLGEALLSSRLAGRTPFDVAELDAVAVALGLEDVFALVGLAKGGDRP